MALHWEDFCQLRVTHSNVFHLTDRTLRPTTSYEDIPDLDAIHAALDDPGLPDLRCPKERQQHGAIITGLTGGSILDAVICVTLGELGDAKFSRGKRCFASVLPERLNLIRGLAARRVPALIYGNLQWLAENIDRYSARGCVQVIFAAGLENYLERIDCEYYDDFLSERLGLEAMMNGWPEEVVVGLRNQGASMRLVINEALEALLWLIDWPMSPSPNLEDFFEFSAMHPGFPSVSIESSDEIENLQLPLVSYSDRMKRAFSWYKSETRFADFLMMTLSKPVSSNNGENFLLPETAVERIDACLFGERMEICIGL